MSPKVKAFHFRKCVLILGPLILKFNKATHFSLIRQATLDYFKVNRYISKTATGDIVNSGSRQATLVYFRIDRKNSKIAIRIDRRHWELPTKGPNITYHHLTQYNLY